MKPLTACQFMENKAYYFPPIAGETEPDIPTTPSWCLRTHDAVGPDGGDVCDDACAAGRECYAPEVEL